MSDDLAQLLFVQRLLTVWWRFKISEKKSLYRCVCVCAFFSIPVGT